MMTKANDFIGWFVVAVVILSPIPLGSNPPIFWAISGTLIGLSAMGYFGWAALGRHDLRYPLRAVGAAGLLWVLTGLWLVIQILPIGTWLGPISFETLRGDVVQSQTLSLAPESTWLMLVRNVSYGLMFFLAAQAGVNEGRAKRLLTVIFWAIVLHAAFGLFQLTQLGDTILGFEKTAYLGYATGTFVNRNSYATFLAMGLAIGAAMIVRIVLSKRERNEQMGEVALSFAAISGGLVVITISLMASQSRMGLFAALVGVVVVALLTLRWLPGSRRLAVIFISLSLVFAAAALWVFGQGLLERLVNEGGSSSGRDSIYGLIWPMIATRPLLGFGGGAFELAFPLFYGPPMSPDMLIDRAHSTYLTLLTELGLGALLPIGSIVLLFGRVFIHYVRQQSGAAVLLAGIGVTMVGATHSVVDFSLEIQANAYLLVAVLGLAVAQVRATKSVRALAV